MKLPIILGALLLSASPVAAHINCARQERAKHDWRIIILINLLNFLNKGRKEVVNKFHSTRRKYFLLMLAC